jgi:SNF2 family DNA or RNA helicase
MIHVSGRHRTLGVPVRPELEVIFPDATRITIGGTDHMLLQHTGEVTTYLRRIGLDVPAPVLSQYDFEGGQPFDIQKRTVALLTTCPRAFVLNGMGTGKTKSALWAWRYLQRIGEAQKALVVAPLSTLNFTWAREVFSTLPGVTYEVLHGSRAKRLARLANTDADIYIVNHDGLATIADELKARTDITTLILDELAVYRNGAAERSKLVRKVAARMKQVWGMTGSPTPNAPTDAHSQCLIVNPTTVDRYFTRFRDQVMTRITNFKFAPKPDAITTVHRVMQPAVRFTLDDILELPQLVERTVDVDMGKKQGEVYKAMEAKARADIESQQITAMNAGAVMNKLQQIACGWVYTREGEVVPLDNEKRIERLVDDVLACEQKVLVFVPFKHALAGISAAFAKEGIEHAVVSGDTPKSERDRIFPVFQQTDKYHALVAHPQCLAHGLTLTNASTIIWFAPIASLEIFEQANARIRRVGQKNKQLVLMYQSTKVEKVLYSKLRAKQKVQNALLDMFAEASE